MKNDILFLDLFVDLFFKNFMSTEFCRFDQISILIIAFYIITKKLKLLSSLSQKLSKDY